MSATLSGTLATMPSRAFVRQIWQPRRDLKGRKRKKEAHTLHPSHYIGCLSVSLLILKFLCHFVKDCVALRQSTTYLRARKAPKVSWHKLFPSAAYMRIWEQLRVKLINTISVWLLLWMFLAVIWFWFLFGPCPSNPNLFYFNQISKKVSYWDPKRISCMVAHAKHSSLKVII